MKLVIGTLAVGLAVGAYPGSLKAGQQKPPAADNTKANQRDRSSAEPTADQAQNNVSDREIMQKIRKAIVDDQSLSTYAHNVKVISQNGKVTLKGPVRSATEKENVAQKAIDVAGANNVTNEITIKSAKKTT